MVFILNLPFFKLLGILVCILLRAYQCIRSKLGDRVIDISGLTRSSGVRSLVVKEIDNACRHIGFFQVVKPRIGRRVMDEALDEASSFLELLAQEKTKYTSSDLWEPVRYRTGLKEGEEVTRNRREEMGTYSALAREVGLELMDAITEGLGLGSTYLTHRMSRGMHVIAVNCYPRPRCPNPEFVVGLLAHSNYSCLTIVLPNASGLEIVEPGDSAWKPVPIIEGVLQVHVGDHLEVLSNGLYQSVVHRAVINVDTTRISIASLHSLAMEETMEPAKELIDEDHPRGYIGRSSYMDFLEFLYANEPGQGWRFIDSLKISEN